MELSIVIVNYNVKHFLEQCLQSVIAASQNINCEIIVVDNNSVDGSLSMLREKFEQIIVIPNSENFGFAKACNQGTRIATGDHILLLNPDTVLPEESLTTCLSFMEANPEAGAIGLRMIDGKGKFLPESKRSLPKPSIAFYKIFGLSSIFPGSKRFNKYHLGHLPDDKIHEVEILTGAFMFIRGPVLKEIGNLDEKFFMYGEDIDLSYRILKAGYKNYYLPSPSIIHFKGESTRKSGINYVINFYRSMAIFVKKHYVGKQATTLYLLINMAIFFRASLSIIKRVIKTMALPILDGFILYGGLIIIIKLWETIKFDEFYDYPPQLIRIITPLYILITIVSIASFGGYRSNTHIRSIGKGLASAAIIIIALYSLFPLEIRYSRAVIILFSSFILVAIPFLRFILSIMGITNISGFGNKTRKVVIVSSEAEYHRIIDLLLKSKKRVKSIGRIIPGSDSTENGLGTLDQIGEIIRINKPDEIIFSSNDLETSTIINTLENPILNSTEKKIACSDSGFVIGSKSGKHRGEVYTLTFTGKK